MNLPEAFAIGSVLLPTAPTLLVASLLLSVWAAGRAARWTRGDAGRARRAAEICAWTGVAGARIGYVAFNWSAYAPQPWVALFLWQPGYSPFAGIAAASAYATWHFARLPVAERGPELRAVAGGYAGGASVLLSILFALHLLAPSSVLRAGDRVPDFTLATLDGNRARWPADFRDRPAVLNFWASWCPPCRREMPLLEEAHSEYAPRGLAVIGIDLEETRATVAAFVASAGVSYPILIDGPRGDPAYSSTAALHERFGGVGLPMTVFVDRAGRVVDVHVGELSRAFLRNRADLLVRP